MLRMRRLPFTELRAEAGPQVASPEDCDNVLHGWGCQHLRGVDSDGKVVDEAIERLEEALEEALSNEEDAEADMMEAEHKYELASDEVNRITAELESLR